MTSVNSTWRPGNGRPEAGCAYKLSVDAIGCGPRKTDTSRERVGFCSVFRYGVNMLNVGYFSLTVSDFT